MDYEQIQKVLSLFKINVSKQSALTIGICILLLIPIKTAFKDVYWLYWVCYCFFPLATFFLILDILKNFNKRSAFVHIILIFLFISASVYGPFFLTEYISNSIPGTTISIVGQEQCIDDAKVERIDPNTIKKGEKAYTNQIRVKFETIKFPIGLKKEENLFDHSVILDSPLCPPGDKVFELYVSNRGKIIDKNVNVTIDFFPYDVYKTIKNYKMNFLQGDAKGDTLNDRYSSTAINIEMLHPGETVSMRFYVNSKEAKPKITAFSELTKNIKRIIILAVSFGT